MTGAIDAKGEPAPMPDALRIGALLCGYSGILDKTDFLKFFTILLRASGAYPKLSVRPLVRDVQQAISGLRRLEFHPLG